MKKQQDDEMKISSVYSKLDDIGKLCGSFAVMQRVIADEIDYEIKLSTIKRVSENNTKPSTVHFFLYALKKGLAGALANRDELVLKGIKTVPGDKVITSNGRVTLPLERMRQFILMEFVWREHDGSTSKPYKDCLFVDVCLSNGRSEAEVKVLDVDWSCVKMFKPSARNFQHNIDLLK
ncbi:MULTISPECIES: hypothetical protein [Vibrio harveyi group]|uniref:hypothetical protein n=1 Tax=Vibrio harveyi group TaxID=717610 RepID=UPI0015F75BA4|nr:hypothetical protein [Vibrio alginolyticus]EJE4208841.1 hypothetical protein [Vibrio parahaemolyticus]HDM8060985.1 hypothetical protein [Vibrio harveyi]